MVSNATEIRFMTPMDTGAPELDEVCGEGFFHLEDLGQCWYVDLAGARCTMLIDRMPRSRWWEEICEAWWERRLPCFHRIVLRVDEIEPGAAPRLVTLDGRRIEGEKAHNVGGWLR